MTFTLDNEIPGKTFPLLIVYKFERVRGNQSTVCINRTVSYYLPTMLITSKHYLAQS